METQKALFLAKYFSTTFVTRARVFLAMMSKFAKKITQFSFFPKRVVPINYLTMDTPQVLFLEKLFSTTFETGVRVFLVSICKSAKHSSV